MFAAKALLIGVVLACLGATAALADNPTVRISKDDQARAVSALLKVTDFGAGWTGGQTATSKLTQPNCPGYDPKESDLIVTGHADARFSYRGAVIFDQDTQVLANSQSVLTDFSRAIRPSLTSCLAYQLRGPSQKVRSVTVKQLTFPKLGSVSAAYRATELLNVGGHWVPFVSDAVFIGVGRFEFSLHVLAPASLSNQLTAFEQGMVQTLVKRANATGAGNVA